MILGFELQGDFEAPIMDRWSKVGDLIARKQVRAGRERARGAAVAPVFADPVANANTESVRNHARSVMQ